MGRSLKKELETEMSETQTEQPPAPVPAPAAKRGRPKKSDHVKVVQGDDAFLDGLTRKECALACFANSPYCVIGKSRDETKTPYCCHPLKGALQSRDMSDPKCLHRLALAKRKLGL